LITPRIKTPFIEDYYQRNLRTTLLKVGGNMTQQFVVCEECGCWTDYSFRGPNLCYECQDLVDRTTEVATLKGLAGEQRNNDMVGAPARKEWAGVLLPRE